MSSLFWLAVGDVDADLAHRFDDSRPDRLRRRIAGRLGADVRRCVALEEGLGHLRAPGIVSADEQDVLHGSSLFVYSTSADAARTALARVSRSTLRSARPIR